MGGPGTSGAVNLSDKDIDSIKKIGGIKEITYMSMGSVKLDYAGQIRFAMVAGVPLDSFDVFKEKRYAFFRRIRNREGIYKTRS